MAEYKVDNQVNVGWGLSLQMAGKTPAIAKRIFDTYDNAKAFVDSTTDTALPGLTISVISDSDPKKNGLYYVNKAAGFGGVGANAGELIKVGEGSGTTSVGTFAEAQAIATADTVGQLVYLTTEDSETTPDTTYTVGLYVVTGAGTLAKLGTSSAGGEDLSGDVASLKGKVSSLEESTASHYGNTTIHLPNVIGSNGQVLKVQDGAPKWTDETAYQLPVAGTNLGGIKNGGDITISGAGEVTVTNGKSHTHALSQISDLDSGWDSILAAAPDLITGATGGGYLSLAKSGANITGSLTTATLENSGTADGLATAKDVKTYVDTAISGESGKLDAHIGNTSNPHQVTKDQVGLANVTNDAQVKRSEMGVANGVATLNENGKVPVSQLDGAMARVFGVEKAVANQGALPEEAVEGDRYYTIDTKKIYEKTSAAWDEGTTPKEDTIYNFRKSDATGSTSRTNILYRWDGSDLVEISASIALGEAAGTAYEGSKGKANAEAISALQTQMTTVTGTGEGSFKKYTDDKISSEVERANVAYAPISLSTKVTANESAITLLNGEEQTGGSVKHTVKQYIDAEVSRADGAYDAKGSANAVKVAVDAYTINGAEISTNPVLGSGDILMTGYDGTIAEAGDTLNAGIKKLATAIQDATSKAGVVSLNGKTGVVTITSTAAGQIEVNGTEEGGATISINGWDTKADKAVVEAYTVNGKKISTNPVLGGKDIVLTEYTTTEDATPIQATDSINSAIAKLEKSIKDVKTSNETVGTNLDAIKTSVGLGESFEYVAPDSSNYLTGATSVKDATSKLDAAIKANESEALGEEEIEIICVL